MRVEVIKDLGIILDMNMNYNTKIVFIAARAKSRLAWIKHLGRINGQLRDSSSSSYCQLWNMAPRFETFTRLIE